MTCQQDWPTMARCAPDDTAASRRGVAAVVATPGSSSGGKGLDAGGVEKNNLSASCMNVTPAGC
jgi:hypothetical protein